MTDELTTPQRVLLRCLDRQRLHRDHKGDYWLEPAEPRDLPEMVYPLDVELLIDAGVLVVSERENVWLGWQITKAGTQ